MYLNVVYHPDYIYEPSLYYSINCLIKIVKKKKKRFIK